MTKTINKWFKLFGWKLWEWNETIRTETGYIETNVTDDSIKLLEKKTADGWQSIKASKAQKTLSQEAM